MQLLLVYLSFGGPLLELETGTSFDGCRPLLLTQELSVEEWRCAHAACAVQTGDKKHGVGTWCFGLTLGECWIVDLGAGWWHVSGSNEKHHPLLSTHERLCESVWRSSARNENDTSTNFPMTSVLGLSIPPLILGLPWSQIYKMLACKHQLDHPCKHSQT